MLYLNKKNLKRVCLITVGGVTMLMLTQLTLYKASRGEEANDDLGVGGNDALSKVGLLAVHGHDIYAEFVWSCWASGFQ